MQATRDIGGHGHRPLRINALALVLGVALAVRLWGVLTHTYIHHPDEVFQYLEQGHRLAFGGGVVPWEYLEGARSWLLPGAIAVLLRLASLVTDAPLPGVLLVRLCAIVASLSVPYVGFRMAERRFGRDGAVLTGLLCALWYQLVYFAPVVMTEEFATYAALLAINAGEPARPGESVARGRRLLAGACFGLSVCLRYQYAPPLALAALWQYRRTPRALGPVVLAALAVVALGDGLLDWLTWGVPFRSLWLNFSRNALQGVGGAMSSEMALYYAAYFLAAWGLLAPLLAGLAGVGAMRAPALAVAAVAVMLLHSLTPHKEVRFIVLAIAVAPILIGLGTQRLLVWLAVRPRLGRGVLAAGLAVLIAGCATLTALAGATPPDAWTRDRSTLAAFEAARTVPGLCGVGVRELWVYRTGGYSFLGRDVPLYFESFERTQHVKGWPDRLPLTVMLHGRSVPQYPDQAFAAAGVHFNVLIAPREQSLLGYAETGCYGTDSQGAVEVCVFRRPGGCV